MKMTGKEFRQWEHKSVTLLGMSGIGKTHAAVKLRHNNWFHYSADYRIGTRYLSEPILDNIKQKAMQIPFLRDLLRTDSIYISNNITVDNLTAVQTFLGKLGNEELGGHHLEEFQRRQHLYRDAEIESMKDVPEFIRKARAIYGYQHFVNDASGSLCEIASPEVMEVLSAHSVIVYVSASPEIEKELIERAESNPKPLFYPDEFLESNLATYMEMKGYDSVTQIVPNEFVIWMFPRLYQARIPRYESIANQYGYTISAEDFYQVQNEADFVDRISDILG